MAAPSGTTLAVTLATQGRTIGDVPVVTRSYTIPRWFPPAAQPTMATHVAMSDVPLPADCRLAGRRAAIEVLDQRIQIDPTGALRDVLRDDFYDAEGLPICRRDRTETVDEDVTTGTQAGARSDRTVVSVAPARSS